jgi:hypothetical protein
VIFYHFQNNFSKQLFKTTFQNNFSKQLFKTKKNDKRQKTKDKIDLPSKDQSKTQFIKTTTISIPFSHPLNILPSSASIFLRSTGHGGSVRSMMHSTSSSSSSTNSTSSRERERKNIYGRRKQLLGRARRTMLSNGTATVSSPTTVQPYNKQIHNFKSDILLLLLFC